MPPVSRLPQRGMVSMVSMEVSKTLGPGSSPGTPAIELV